MYTSEELLLKKKYYTKINTNKIKYLYKLSRVYN